MDISANGNTIGKFLSNAGEELFIPRYQRPYSWNKENLKELISDIENSKGESDGHFIGAIIRCEKHNESKWDIIDGQQRLTSISILLAALRDVYVETISRESNLKNSIQRYLTPNDYMGEKYYKISQETGDECFMDNYRLIVEDKESSEREAGFKKNTEAGRKVIESYNFFKDEIRKIVSEEIPAEKMKDYETDFSSDNPQEIKIRLLLKKILQVKFVDINMKNIVEAYKVFNTLNSRGMDLKQSDLIKSHILGHLHHKDGVDLNRKKWEDFVKSITENNSKEGSIKISEDDFFYHYLVSRGNAPKAKKGTFAEYEQMVKTPEDADKLLTRLAYEINLYRVIFDPEYKIPGESQRKRNHATWEESLKALNIFGLSQPHPLILAILRRYFDDSDKAVGTTVINDIFSLMEDSHFVLTVIHGEPGNKFTNTYNSMAKEVFNLSKASGKSVGNNKITDIQERLKKKYQGLMKNITKEVFVNEFVDKMDYGKYYPEVRYFLEKYQSETLRKPGNILTAEHIIPRSSVGKIAGPKATVEEKEQIRKIIDSPGNLILLRNKDNERIGTKDINEKIAFFRTLDYANTLPEEIFEMENMSIENADEKTLKKILRHVEDRNKRMAEFVYDKILSDNNSKNSK